MSDVCRSIWLSAIQRAVVATVVAKSLISMPVIWFMETWMMGRVSGLSAKRSEIIWFSSRRRLR